jgi:four helix bundle protein
MSKETSNSKSQSPPVDEICEKGRPGEKVYDLEERSARFGEAVVRFAKSIPLSPVTQSIIGQMVRAATSVGANYCEADDAGSRKEFRYRISICKREARESKHWLRMLAAALPERADEARVHWREAKELHLIFVSIYRKTGTHSRAGADSVG